MTVHCIRHRGVIMIPIICCNKTGKKLRCARYLHAPVDQPKKMAVSRPRHKPNSANASEEMSWKEPFSSYFSFPLCCTGRLVVVNFDENSLIPKETNAEKPRVLRRPSGISFVPGTSLHDSKDIITPPWSITKIDGTTTHFSFFVETSVNENRESGASFCRHSESFGQKSTREFIFPNSLFVFPGQIS